MTLQVTTVTSQTQLRLFDRPIEPISANLVIPRGILFARGAAAVPAAVTTDEVAIRLFGIGPFPNSFVYVQQQNFMSLAADQGESDDWDISKVRAAGGFFNLEDVDVSLGVPKRLWQPLLVQEGAWAPTAIQMQPLLTFSGTDLLKAPIKGDQLSYTNFIWDENAGASPDANLSWYISFLVYDIEQASHWAINNSTSVLSAPG